jgi:hypothetical protein
MSQRKWFLFITALVLMAGTAGLLAQLRSHQRLGAPGVRTHPLDDPIRVEVDLPEQVLDYKSKLLTQDEIVTNTLPHDTSFGQRLYEGPDGFWINMQVVLMGTDRTSLHKPQFCLEGQGWRIDDTLSVGTTIPVERPCSYDLPVVKLIATRQIQHEGQARTVRGIYVYWFVADNALSASAGGGQRMWLMARELLRTGVLQRWAYVSCFALTEPGQEDATFGRIKKFIAASVPDFQLTPRPPVATESARK